MNNINLSDWLVLNEPGERMYSIYVPNIAYIEWFDENTLSTEVHFIGQARDHIYFSCKSKTAAKLASYFGIDDLISEIEKRLGCSLAEQQAKIDEIGF